MLKKVISEIEKTSSEFPFIKNIVKMDETEHTIKCRLILKEDLFVQVYVNVETDTVGFVLINKGQRVYGRDAIEGKWHRHTFEKPLYHDFSPTGVKKVNLKGFLIEVQEILDRENLL
ncbi:MAG TPA: hypothetical protein DCQ99_01035 [Nitrospinae bacterium]|nr:hypothetical protein [Nitrospinota bacterium]HBA25929.1 hypothetical protein [Nitrospinota bacterium]